MTYSCAKISCHHTVRKRSRSIVNWQALSRRVVLLNRRRLLTWVWRSSNDTLSRQLNRWRVVSCRGCTISHRHRKRRDHSPACLTSRARRAAASITWTLSWSAGRSRRTMADRSSTMSSLRCNKHNRYNRRKNTGVSENLSLVRPKHLSRFRRHQISWSRRACWTQLRKSSLFFCWRT